jgi:hypothetical protein
MKPNPDFPETDDFSEPAASITSAEILGADLHRELLEKFAASPEGKARQAYNEAYDAAKLEEAQLAEAAEQRPDADPGETPDARTLANRLNAKKSSGPTSLAGQAASSRNATTHGIFVQDLSKFLSIEELDRYERFIKSIVDDLRPSGATELVLARRAADIQFRLEMLRTAEFHAYSRQYAPADSMPSLIARHKDPIALVSLYDSRFQRSFKSTMDELHWLQNARKTEEEHALKELKEIALQHVNEGTTFQPADFGFVISKDLVFQKARLHQAQNKCVNDRKSLPAKVRRPRIAA